MLVEDKWEDVRFHVCRKQKISLLNGMWSCMTDYVQAYINTEISYLTDMHHVKAPILGHLTSKQ